MEEAIRKVLQSNNLSANSRRGLVEDGSSPTGYKMAIKVRVSKPSVMEEARSLVMGSEAVQEESRKCGVSVVFEEEDPNDPLIDQ